MVIAQYCLLIIMGFSAGTLIAAGVFALITSTGVVTRMADKTHTAHFVKGYETAIMIGGIWWNLFWVFDIYLNMSVENARILQVFMGVFQGIFVGCLAVSLAETLNGTAVFSRRAKLYRGLGTIILFTALGKAIHSMIQFLI